MTTTATATTTITTDPHLLEARKERQMRRISTEMEELRSKLERDKAEALSQQKEAMNRAFRVQMSKLLKEKEDLVRKCQQSVGSKGTGTGPSSGSSSSSAGELQKLTHEIAILRSEKKKLEEQLQVWKEGEQYRFENMRSLLDDKTRELSLLQKQLKQQLARLREESRVKDRVISHLESELRLQTGRAQQFRDILEQNLISCTSKMGHHQQQPPTNGSTASSCTDDEGLTVKRLQIQLDDLRMGMKEQQETFAHEKRELLRRLSEADKEKEKSKRYLCRNVQLSVKNNQLSETIKKMQAASRHDAATPDDVMDDQQHHQTTNSNHHLKRSLTSARPGSSNVVNQSGLGVAHPSKNIKQRRMEYVQQIQRLRKEQRYYSMWELPPLLEVETDSSGEACGSSDDGSLSPTGTSGVCSSSDSTWSDETRRELEVLFSQLSREHGELQRNYQILHEKLRQLTCFSDADAANVNYATLQADYAAARARIRDLEEILQLKNNPPPQPSQAVPSLLEIQAKFIREKGGLQTQLAVLNHRLAESKSRQQAIQAELNEARDQNELLEFRILELEEFQERASGPPPPSSSQPCCSTDQRARKDVCTDTDSDDTSVGDSGITSLASLVVDCCPSSPSISSTSPDSDYLGEKISSVKAELQMMVSSLNDPKQKSLLAQLQALLGVCQTRLVRTNKMTTSDSDCWTQLQESGIFEEDQPQQRILQVLSAVGTQTDQVERADVSISVTIPLPLGSGEPVEDKSVQAGQDVCDSAAQYEPVCQDQSVQVSSIPPRETIELSAGSSQTEEQIMTLTDFKDIELYYVEQIELLQKEKASQRKKFQACRDETAQAVQQLELLNRQFYEREKQFEEILQKNCEAFERELEAASSSAASSSSASNEEVSAMVWQEIKDYVSDHHSIPSKASGTEFVQATISSLHGLCSELGQLRAKVADLADMEQAFQTTLRQADGLVHHIEEKHLRRIRELELNEHELRQQLEQLIQQQQQRQRPTAVHKEETYNFDEDEDDGSLQFKLQELKNENEALTAQVGKCQDLQDYCQQLHGRLEEFEQRERSLQLAVQEAERRFATREQRYKEEVELLRAELEKCRESESGWRHRLEQKEGQLGLVRTELEAEHKTISALEAEIRDLQSKLTKDDTCFRNEVTKLRSQLNVSMVQLNELESLNCALRDQIVEHQHRISSLERNLEMESCQNQDLVAENGRLIQELMSSRGAASTVTVTVGKPLTEELFEVESDDAPPASTVIVPISSNPATLDDFREISLPSTPTVVDGCADVFEEHFKVLESLESYLETQQLFGTISEDESGISTSPSIHENEPMALLEAQLSQLRTEKHFLLNSVMQGQKKDEIIQILIEQLKNNAPRQYLVETAAQIRTSLAEQEAEEEDHRDKDIEAVCRLLEAPIDLSVTAVLAESCPSSYPPQPLLPPVSTNRSGSTAGCSFVTTRPKVARQRTVTVLPDEDPLLPSPTDLRVTRKVGHDGLVIAWNPSLDQECAGYLICVNGHEAQRVRNPTRTKAVLCGLDLHSEMEICIYSMSDKGLVSSPSSALYQPEEFLADSTSTSLTPEPQQAGAATTTNSPREVVVQTFYTNSSVTVRSSRRVAGPPSATSGSGSRIPIRSSVP